MIEPMPDTPRSPVSSTLVSALVGVLLLGAVFVFTVVVPKIGDDEAAASGETTAEAEQAPALEPVALPDALPPNLVAVDSGALPAAVGAQFGDVSGLREQEDSIGAGLESLFGDTGAFRLYAADDGSALVSITVLDRAPGLYVPEAPPVDPATLGLERSAVEMVEADGAVCSLNWGEEVPAGQPIDPAALPGAIRCQRGEGERTFEISAQGITLDATIAVLDAVQAS